MFIKDVLFTPGTVLPRGAKRDSRGYIVMPDGNTFDKEGGWQVPEGGYVDCIFYPFDHEQVILKKDTIKEIHVDADGSQITIWEASDEEKERYFSSPRDNLG